MTEIRINTTVELDAKGRLGAWTFIIAPLVGAMAFVWYGFELGGQMRPGYGSAPPIPLSILLAIAAGIAWAGSAILLLVGRSYRHEVRVQASRENAPSRDPETPAPPRKSDWHRIKEGG